MSNNVPSLAISICISRTYIDSGWEFYFISDNKKKFWEDLLWKTNYYTSFYL